MKQNLNIICAGSSITWTGGLMSGFVGELDRKIRSSGGHLFPEQIQCSGGTSFRHFKMFDGYGIMLSGTGCFLEFDFTGDTLYLCQLIRRVSGYGEIQVRADGAVVDCFDNRNPTLGQDSKSFTANGKETLFSLGRAFTYNHQVKINGRLLRGKVSCHDYDEMDFAGNDYLVMRSLNDKAQVEHVLCFPVPLPEGAAVTVDFSYGESIGYTACTVGENDEEQMESVYGFAGPKPNYGLDFRYTNPGSFREIKLKNTGTHRIRLEIIGGEHPYFIFNFAADRMVNIMNAGIGGWYLQAFMNDERGRNVDTVISILKPDVMFLEYSANDDWFYFQRKTCGLPYELTKPEPLLELYSLKDGKACNCAGKILELTANSLRCLEMRDAEPGDIARIGNEIREISEVENDRIYWQEPLPDTSVEEITIRSLKAYENHYRELIDRIRTHCPNTVLFLTAPAPANYERRQLWGYEFALKKLASEYRNCYVIDMKKYFAVFQPSDWLEHEFTSTGDLEYKLPWTGYSQYFQLTPNYKFTVECIDRFELETQGEFSLSNKAETDPRKKFWKLNDPTPMRLIFHSPPPDGIKFKIRYSPNGWSHDYCHPNPSGCRIYGAAYFKELSHCYNKTALSISPTNIPVRSISSSENKTMT